MRTIALAALAVVAAPSLSLAAAPTAALTAPAVQGLSAEPELEGKVRVSVSRQRLAAGEGLAEHRQPYVRSLFVVSGRLKVSNLVSGEEQVAGPGEIAIEAAGDWHVAQVLGDEPVELFVIDQMPAEAATTGAGGL